MQAVIILQMSYNYACLQIMSAILGIFVQVIPSTFDDNFHAACMQVAVLMQSNKQYKIYLVPIDKLSSEVFRTAVL